MKRQLVALAFGIAGALGAQSAMALDTIVQFNRGIGVDPVAGIDATTGLPVRNDVLGVVPGGRPWVIHKLRASVYVDGTISARGSGLLLSAGNGIGTRAAVTQVVATLFCGGTAFTSQPADLDTAGDFRIKSALSALPPTPCATPVLLIRNAAGNGAWFAAGVVGGGDDD